MRRTLKVAGLVLLGVALSAAGFAAWYQWGRTSDSLTQVANTAEYTDSFAGMTITKCEINQSGTKAVAYGSFQRHPLTARAIGMAVYNAKGNILGYAYDNYPDTSTGAYWQLDAHILQGLGSVTVCRVGFVNYIAHPLHP